MTSRISLREQLPLPFSKPQEIITYSQTADEEIVFNDSALKYYYLPHADVERRPIDLTAGFDPKTYDPEIKSTIYLDQMLKALIEHEKRTEAKSDAEIITWRGIWREIITMSQPHCDQYLFKDGLHLLVTGFDHQIFLAHEVKPKKPPVDFSKLSSEEKLRELNNQKFQYTGTKFESVALLDKPWGECTRDEIEARYTDKTYNPSHVEYGMLIRSKIGDIPLVYAAETDAVEGFKPFRGDRHKQYVELKTSNEIRNARQAENFERKLFKTWVQSYLSRVPKIVYGFRDPQTMQLKSIEEFATDSIPKRINASKVTPKHLKWSAKRALGFFGVMAKFLKDRVEDGKTYTLQLDQHTKELVLKPLDRDLGRKHAFLSDEFVEWRTQRAQN